MNKSNKSWIRQLSESYILQTLREEEGVHHKKILSEQFEMLGDVTGKVYPPEGYTGSTKKSLFKAGDNHYVVSHGGTVKPGTVGEITGQFEETSIFPSDEKGNFDTSRSLMTLSGHHDHESAARFFAKRLGVLPISNDPSEQFPVPPRNQVAMAPINHPRFGTT